MEDDRRSKRQSMMREKTMENAWRSAELKVVNQETNLPQQLITQEILIRFPVKSLIQFKLVCKEWNSIISSHEFAKLHLNLSKLSPSHKLIKTLFIDSDDSSGMLKLRTNNNGGKEEEEDDDDEEEEIWDWIPLPKCESLVDEVSIMGSCNGLVCLFVKGTWNENGNLLWGPKRPNLFCIWNPCINEFCEVVLPKTCCNLEGGGFGYVSSVDDYKIVVFGTSPLKKWGFVYSFRANLWTEIPKLCENLPILRWKMDGVLVDEMLYWGFGNIVTGFNLKDYTFHEIPITQWSDFNCSTTCVVGGSLCAWGYVGVNLNILHLWRFEQKESSGFWIKVLELDVSSSGVNILGFLGCTNSGKIMLHNFGGKVFTVDPNENPPKFVSLKHNSASVISFQESLVSPYHYQNGTKDAGLTDAQKDAYDIMARRKTINRRFTSL